MGHNNHQTLKIPVTLLYCKVQSNTSDNTAILYMYIAVQFCSTVKCMYVHVHVYTDTVLVSLMYMHVHVIVSMYSTCTCTVLYCDFYGP